MPSRPAAALSTWLVSYGGPYQTFVLPPPGRSLKLPALADPFAKAFQRSR